MASKRTRSGNLSVGDKVFWNESIGDFWSICEIVTIVSILTHGRIEVICSDGSSSILLIKDYNKLWFKSCRALEVIYE
jgi:hypothetical protein